MKIALVVYFVATASLIDSRYIEHREWNLFKSVFNKIYHREREESFRRTTFFENKINILEHNKLYRRGEVLYELGINQYSDLTKDELVDKTPKSFTGRQVLWPMMTTINKNNTSVAFSKLERVPPLVDWRVKGCVVRAKNQGSCYAYGVFSAVAAVESHYCIKERVLLSLSEQNLVDCTLDMTCDGGWPYDAFQWIMDIGGISTSDIYPFESADGYERICHRRAKKPVKVTNFKILPAGNESALEQALIQIGPVAVSMHGSGDFYAYKSGIYDGSKHGCTGNDEVLNISVVVVGFGTDPKGVEYWIVKNSYGENWGERGFMKILRNKNNHCGIASFASYPIVE